MKKLYEVLITLIFLNVIKTTVHAEHKSAQVVFKKWFDYQTVYKDRSICELNKTIDWKKFCEVYKASREDIHGYEAFLQTAFEPAALTTGDIVSRQATKNLKSIRLWLDKSPGRFLSYLTTTNAFNDAVNQQEEEAPFNEVIDKNKAFLRLLLHHDNSRMCDEYHFACVNRLFEYCFSPYTFNLFFTTLNDEKLNPINRFSYSTLWYNLVGDGWKHWHENCLKTLAKNGGDVLYIAGGNDIHEPLRYGVYNMRIIDPVLPSQDEYYAENVEWLLKGAGTNHGIGDTFDVIDVNNKILLVTRTNYQEHGTFDAQLSTGKKVTLPQSETTWIVAERDSGKTLGKIFFERRYAAQRDFEKKSKITILASFNELYFVGAQQRLGGWGIDVSKFDKNLKVYVKQLRKPLSKQVMQNLYKTDETRFNFISLGSCPT